MAKSPSAFLREATGLIREWSTVDAFYYNVLTIGIFGWVSVLLFLTTPYAYPGGNIPLAFAITGIMNAIASVAFVLLAVSMPRSGGEYVFQSRVLHPALGFAIVFTGWVVWSMNWAAWNMHAIMWLGVYPLLSNLGIITGDSAWFDMAAWATSTTGITLISGVWYTLIFVVLFAGMKAYARLQWLLFWGTVTAIAIFVGISALTTEPTFEAAFNSFMLKYQTDPNFYQVVIDTAKTAGFEVNPQFSLTNTLGVVPIVYMWFIWFYWSTYNLGEIKKADTVRNQVVAQSGSVLLVMVFFLFMSIAFIGMIGSDFMYALAYHWNEGTEVIGVFPTDPAFTLFPAMVTGSVPLLIVFMIGIMLNVTQYPFNCAIAPTRIMLAMSFDRVLPARVADVHERFHIPHVALIINYILGWMWYYLITFTGVSAWLTSVMAIASVSIGATLLSAVLLPYRCKDIYSASPASKYKIAGIPVISICGIIGFIWNLIMLYFYLVVPAYGGGNWVPVGVNVAILIAAFIYYYIVRWYRTKQGVNIDLAFKQIPPE